MACTVHLVVLHFGAPNVPPYIHNWPRCTMLHSYCCIKQCWEFAVTRSWAGLFSVFHLNCRMARRSLRWPGTVAEVEAQLSTEHTVSVWRKCGSKGAKQKHCRMAKSARPVYFTQRLLLIVVVSVMTGIPLWSGDATKMWQDWPFILCVSSQGIQDYGGAESSGHACICCLQSTHSGCYTNKDHSRRRVNSCINFLVFFTAAFCLPWAPGLEASQCLEQAAGKVLDARISVLGHPAIFHYFHMLP